MSLIFDLLIHPGGQEREAELVRIHAESQRLLRGVHHITYSFCI